MSVKLPPDLVHWKVLFEPPEVDAFDMLLNMLLTCFQNKTSEAKVCGTMVTPLELASVNALLAIDGIGSLSAPVLLSNVILKRSALS